MTASWDFQNLIYLSKFRITDKTKTFEDLNLLCNYSLASLIDVHSGCHFAQDMEIDWKQCKSKSGELSPYQGK